MTLRRVTNVINVAKDEKSGLVANIYSVLVRWWNHFCQVLIVRGVNNGRQTEMQQRLSEASAFDVEVVIEKLKSHKSSGIHQIPAELITATSNKICSEILNLLILFGIRRNWDPG